MQIVSSIEELRSIIASWREEGHSVGLVPTMGYLHEGHESLIDAAKASCDKVVVSDFVNPIQFGPTEDLDSYPRDLDRDSAICEAHGVDVIFHPEVDEMYPEGYSTYVHVDGLTDGLCGASRPGHFQGVCTVVSKLFNIVGPDKAFFGQKDAQQLAVIKRMVADLNIPVKVVGCPIVREPDGLAKSSRNSYLSAEERQGALVLSRAIRAGQEAIAAGENDARALVQLMEGIIEAEPLASIDYLQVVDGLRLQPVEKLEAPVLVAMAVRIGKTRLIDNFIIEED